MSHHSTNVFRYAAIGLIESGVYRGLNLACVVLATVRLLLEDPLGIREHIL